MATVDTFAGCAFAAVRGPRAGGPRRDPARGPLGAVSQEQRHFRAGRGRAFLLPAAARPCPRQPRPRRPANRSWCAMSPPARPSASRWRSGCALSGDRDGGRRQRRAGLADRRPGRGWSNGFRRLPPTRCRPSAAGCRRPIPAWSRCRPSRSSSASRMRCCGSPTVRPQGRPRRRDRLPDQPPGHRADDRHHAAHREPHPRAAGRARAWSRAAASASCCASRIRSSCWRSGRRTAARREIGARALPLTAKARPHRGFARDPRELRPASRRHAFAQRSEKFVAIDAMLAAGVVHGMEGRDRTADACHPEGEETRGSCAAPHA